MDMIISPTDRRFDENLISLCENNHNRTTVAVCLKVTLTNGISHNLLSLTDLAIVGENKTVESIEVLTINENHLTIERNDIYTLEFWVYAKEN